MAEETGTQKAAEGNEPEAGNQDDKKFTQAELDAIVNDRLRRERKKYADYEELKKAASNNKAEQDANAELLAQALNELTELKAEKEAREAADAHAALVKEVAAANNVDAEFFPLLTATDKEGLEAQAKLLATKFAEPSRREGGKPPATGASNADLFAEWAEKAMNR